jgi:hypothetical protein
MQWLRHTSGGLFTTSAFVRNKEEANTCCHDGH